MCWLAMSSRQIGTILHNCASIPGLILPLCYLLRGSFCRSCTWMRSLGMHLWYGQHAHGPLHRVLDAYRSTDKTISVQPYPPHVFRGRLHYVDIRYALLQSFARGDSDDIMPFLPACSVPSPLDYSFSWHLEQALLVSGIIPRFFNFLERSADLTANFAAQLELFGLFDGAVYVLLHRYPNSATRCVRCGGSMCLLL